MKYDRIRDLREDADLYQRQLAEILHCSQRNMLSMLSFASSLKDKLGFTNQQIRDALSISNEDWALIADKL